MEPFSLVTGVASTVQICFKVGLQLKSFRDGMKIVDKRIEGILQDVNSLHNVLEAMQGTIKSSESKGSLHGTGHIGYHWSNLSQAVKDGSDILSELQELLEGTNKEVSVLDEARRELRYRLAVDQITMFRQRARSARDVLQLSLHSIILWNQVALHESTQQIIPSLSQLYSEVRRIATQLNAEIRGLELTSDANQAVETQQARNLRSCVRSAVSILSSTSTIHAEITGDRASVIADSDFGDCFPPELDDSKRQWIESHQIQEESSIFAASETSGIPTLSSYENDYPSESDGEVEVDMILFFFQSGTESLDKQDYAEAEQFLKHCNYWLTLALQQSESSSSQNLPVTKLEILDSLFQVYFQQKQWQEAESVARESLALSQRNSDPSNKDQDVLSYTLRLAEVLIERQNYPETEFLARRCLRGYKKLGHSGEAGFKESLDVLIRICEDEGNLRKLESYKLYRLGFQRSQARSSRLSISKELKIRDDDPADTSTLEEPTNTPEVVGAEDNQEPKQEAESAGTEASKSHSSPAPSKTLESNLNSPSQIILRNSKEEHPAAASNSKAPLRAKPLDPPQESNPAADNHRDASATVAKLHNASPKLGEKLVSSRTGSLHPSERPTSQHPRWSSSSNTGYRSGEVPDQETSNLPQVNVEGPLASPASSEGRRQSWHPNHSQRNSNTDELIINVGNGSSPQENAPPIKSQNNVPDAESDSPPKNPPISRAINIYTETNTNNQPDTTELPETSKNVTRDPTMRDPGPKVSQDVITLTRGKDGQNEAVSEETNGIKNTGDQSDENDLSPKVDQSEQDEESELDDASVLIENFSINKLRGEWWSQQPVVKFLGAPGCGKSSLLEAYIKTRCPANVEKIGSSAYRVVYAKGEELHGKILLDPSGDYNLPRVSHVVFCVDLGKHKDLENILSNWLGYLRSLTHGTRLTLAGCKGDLRTESPDSVATVETLKAVANRVRAERYFECSAMTMDGVTNLLDIVPKTDAPNTAETSLSTYKELNLNKTRTASERSLLNGVSGFRRPVVTKKKSKLPWKR